MTDVIFANETEAVLGRTADLEIITHGEVFTRRWVVELILDLVGYTSDRDLGAMRAVEPACGEGAFLEVMVERLSESCTTFDRDIRECVWAIQAFDLVDGNVTASRRVAEQVLSQSGCKGAKRVAKAWVSQRDFLLHPPATESVDFVVGNPPYIRLEDPFNVTFEP